jgi:hypothetical protein
MDIQTTFKVDALRITLQKYASNSKVALVYHLKIADKIGYENWLDHTNEQSNSKRLFRLKVDPVPREGMLIDEFVIDEHHSALSALDFISTYRGSLAQVCSVHTILIIIPDPPLKFYIAKSIAWLVSKFNGAKDSEIQTSQWHAENVSVWPDSNQMNVARSQSLEEPLFVYNLNKYKPIADYGQRCEHTKSLSGYQAYKRYARILRRELLRRQAYPVYGGKPICLLVSNNDDMLLERWDHFVFVRYPHRRNMLSMIETDEFQKSEIHRDAGLARVAVLMASSALHL